MVEYTSLENWRSFTGTVGSNPTLSAIFSASFGVVGFTFGFTILFLSKEQRFQGGFRDIPTKRTTQSQG